MSDTMPNKFILTHVAPGIWDHGSLTLTLQSTGEFDRDAILSMLGRIVTLSEVQS
jgi:hypothetical protein